ncbi:MAG: hypothetical protein ABI543_03840 [Ignavibacteria bacterium]
MRSKQNVFLGLENIAGIFTSLKKGFEQNDIPADFYSLSEHIYGYETDRVIKYSNNSFIRKFQKSFLLLKLLFNYKYFIFDSTGSLLPGFRDIKLFRLFGKKTMVIFTGCDIRLPEKVEQFQWNPCRECTDNYKNFVGCVLATKPEKVKIIEDKFDLIACAEETAGALSRKYYPTLFPIDVEKFKYAGTNPGKRLKILHAPSNPEYKGTRYIITAIEKLQSEFDFEFNIVKDVKAEDLYREIERSDLIIDQMLVGFYGLFSIEAMAMGKPVVCYIREDILKNSPDDMPVINADPDTLYDVLKEILSSPNKLIQVGNNSRSYVERYHDAKIISEQYYKLLEGEIN